MADARNTNKPSRPSRDWPGLGVVRVRSKPAPDAQDRLRRLFTLLVRYATADETTSKETHSPGDDDGESEGR